MTYFVFLVWFVIRSLARVAELVDAADLKSAGYCNRAGSIPAPGTNNIDNLRVSGGEDLTSEPDACRRKDPAYC